MKSSEKLTNKTKCKSKRVYLVANKLPSTHTAGKQKKDENQDQSLAIRVTELQRWLNVQ